MNRKSFVCRLAVLLLLAVAPRGAAQSSVPAAVPAGGAAAPQSAFVQLRPGDVAPEFTVTGPKGETIRLSDFKGKIVIVDVSATWCGPCQAAMPNNDRVARKYAEQGVVLLGVTASDTRAAYDGWIARNADKYKFTMAFDPAGKDGWQKSVFSRDYHVTGFPTMFVIGRDGRISETVNGGGAGEDYRLEYALARAGAKVELASLPPEPKRDPNAPKSIPAVMKTPAIAAGGASTGMIGMGAAAPAGGGFTPEKFGSVARGTVVPDFTVTGADGKPVTLSSFRGKPLLLQFCTSNGPQAWLPKIAAAYKEQGLATVVVFSATERAAFDQWVAANPMPGFAVAWDPAGKAWGEGITNTVFGVGMYPATAVLNAKGELWSGVIGMGDKVIAMVYSMLARNGLRLTEEHLNALVAAGGAMRAGGGLGAAAAAPARPATLAAEAANSRPPFLENYGKLKKGEPVPDLDLQDAAGQAVKLSGYTKGKTAIFAVYGGGGPYADGLALYEPWSRKYADQGLVVVALSAYTTREDFDTWRTANAGKFSFPVVFDPTGRGPQPGKPFDELTPEEKKDFMARQREHMAKVAPLVFSGGVMAPVPHAYVIDAKGNLVGICVGGGAHVAQGVGNMLLRAGIKLAPEDMPTKVFTAEETKPPTPEPKREMITVGVPAPDFLMTDLTGKPVKLSDYRGKVIVLDFWATWCGPCIASMPHTQQVAQKYKDQGVVVIGACTSDDRAKFESWVATNREKYPDFIFAHDPLERKPDRASARLYGVGGIPQQFIVDREGRIAAAVTGYLKGEVLLDAALAKAGIKVAPEILAQAELDQKNRDAMR